MNSSLLTSTYAQGQEPIVLDVEWEECEQPESVNYAPTDVPDSGHYFGMQPELIGGTFVSTTGPQEVPEILVGNYATGGMIFDPSIALDLIKAVSCFGSSLTQVSPPVIRVYYYIHIRGYQTAPTQEQKDFYAFDAFVQPDINNVGVFHVNISVENFVNRAPSLLPFEFLTTLFPQGSIDARYLIVSGLSDEIGNISVSDLGDSFNELLPNNLTGQEAEELWSHSIFHAVFAAQLGLSYDDYVPYMSEVRMIDFAEFYGAAAGMPLILLPEEYYEILLNIFDGRDMLTFYQ